MLECSESKFLGSSPFSSQWTELFLSAFSKYPPLSFLSLQGIARLQRHEQIVDEVKLALKPFFKHGKINKDDYKLIMRKSVEKVCGGIAFSKNLLWYHFRRVF